MDNLCTLQRIIQKKFFLKQDGQNVYHIVATTHDVVNVAQQLMKADCPLDVVDKNVSTLYPIARACVFNE